MQVLGYAAVACAIFAVLPVAVQGEQEDRFFTLRAVGPHVTDEIIQRVAELAEPVVLNASQRFDDQTSTPRHIITQLCGGIRDVYVTEVARANGLTNLPLDEPLGQKANSFKWPACLYVRSTPEQIEVKSGDTAYDLYQAYTGGGGSPKAIARFFDTPIRDLEWIQPGTTLKIPAFTRTVPITARNGQTNELLMEITRLDPKGKMVRDNPPSVEGEIILGMSDGATAAGGDCEGAPELADAEAIVHAYRFSKSIAIKDDVNVAGGRAELAVVDNGFFGAHPLSTGIDPFEGSPFKRAYFKSDPDYTIASPMVLGETIHPLNYGYVEPNLDSGHGTHVTGLMLGGPAFSQYLDKLGSEPWASITVINVGRGKRTLVKGAYEFLFRFLADGAWRIVNLSIAHDGRADRRVGPSYGNLFEMATNSLFVVAAGNNNGVDVRDRGIFPAAYGGIDRSNVITVAAIDSNDHLTKFSNRSGQAVDMAAPGCRISSWIAYDKPTVTMSGTSQAAPKITFGASLLRSIAIKARPATLKNRLVVSGDLLPSSERRETAFEVKINIPRALLWFQDDLEVEDGGTVRRLLGSIRSMAPLMCKDEQRQIEKSVEDMFALKRTEGVSYFYGGLLTQKVQSPCKVIDEASASVAFSATHEILSDGRIEPLKTVIEQNWPLIAVRQLVARTPLTELQ
ncbi:S8 family serine peptidase [Pseudomonas sp. B21-017]|uniref:S8 family serine peptidase n=1 Tax=Pseudomonas sp. B21-017 TaxID=2895474 RepID=UPI00215FBB00|nr:S8 family serine peptidase [Pseudomonas sp. B21-017]UVM36380.1 S8 family serine peptidase [Pseudomonas sp. B21-017]